MVRLVPAIARSLRDCVRLRRPTTKKGKILDALAEPRRKRCKLSMSRAPSNIQY